MLTQESVTDQEIKKSRFDCTSPYGACNKVKLSPLTDIKKSIIASYLFYSFIHHAVHSLNTAEKLLRYNAGIMNDLCGVNYSTK